MKCWKVLWHISTRCRDGSLNIRLKPEDYVFILNHSESKILFVDQDLYSLIRPVLHKFETVMQIIVHYKEPETEETDYDSWLASFSAESFDRSDIDENDVCSLLYTSGTTGNPKGVMLSHRNNYLHALSTMHHLRVSDSDVYLHVLPMFHVNAWGAPFYYTANGATHICSRKSYARIHFQSTAGPSGIRPSYGTDRFECLLQYYEAHHPVVRQDVRVVIAGSAPPPAFITRVEEELGWEFIQVYGMTESSPLSLISTIRSHLTDLSKAQQTELKSKAGFSDDWKRCPDS